MSEPLSTATSTITGEHVIDFYTVVNRTVDTTAEQRQFEALVADHVNMVEVTTNNDETRSIDGSETGHSQLFEELAAIEHCQVVPKTIHELDTTVAVDGEYMGRKTDGTTFQIPFTHRFELDADTGPKTRTRTVEPFAGPVVDPDVVDRGGDESATTDE